MTIFSKIIAKEIPADIVFENERLLAFRDINPQAPVHILLIPKKEIVDIASVEKEDKELLGEMMLAVQEIVQQEGLSSGFRLVTNTGSDGGQEVPHLHFHILGGRKMTWPPG